MELIERLLFGSESLWGGGVAHSVLILALVVALGVMLGKLKVAGVSLGVTGILFVGIGFSYFGMNVDEHLMHFLKEFGLILFVYSIGLQVGPGFFSSFRKGGVTLNKLAVLVVALGVATTVALYYITGLSMTTMVGVMSGAVTNTPGLGAAQQAFSDMHAGADAPDIATGYAVAYPLGVVGAILTLIGLRYLLRIDVKREEAAAGQDSDAQKDLTTRRLSVEIVNAAVNGKTVAEIRDLALRDFVISRISRGGGSPELADASTALHCGDRILLIAAPRDVEALVALLGREVDAEPMVHDKAMISRRILITKPELNGKTLSELRVRSTCGVTITRINRSGIDLVASGNLQLQIGDRVTVVGPELSVAHAERLFGNSLKRLNHPNLIPIFTGIALGVLLGSISFWIPGIPQPVKLGLAGGPLIVAILIGRYGPHYKLVTYTTMSANLMLREVGISLFLAGVGLGAGEEFVPTLAAGGYVWIAFGARATPLGTVNARSDVGERASAVLPFHLQQPTFEPLPFGQDQASRFGDRESRLLGRDSGRDEQRRAVTRDVLLHIEPERRASPAAAVVAALPAIAAHPFGVAEAGDVCCGGQFRREIPGGVSKRMIHAAKL